MIDGFMTSRSHKKAKRWTFGSNVQDVKGHPSVSGEVVSHAHEAVFNWWLANELILKILTEYSKSIHHLTAARATSRQTTSSESDLEVNWQITTKGAARSQAKMSFGPLFQLWSYSAPSIYQQQQKRIRPDSFEKSGRASIMERINGTAH